MKKYCLLSLVFALIGGSVFAQMRPESIGSDSLVLVGSNGNTTSLLPGSISTSFSLTLPNNAGTNGDVLQTNGSGVLTWTSPTNAAVPAGTILPFGGTSAPSGFVLCDGASLDRTTYASLFAVIGTAFGAADGSHFNVPDFRGRFLRGLDGSAGRDPDSASRTAMNTGGNTGNNMGSVQVSQYASHNHSVYGGSGAGTATNVGSGIAQGLAAIGGATGLGVYTTASATSQTFIQSNGGNETRPINANINFIIKL